MTAQSPQLLNRTTRLHLHGAALVAVFFLFVYSRLVCPFINSLGSQALLLNLSAILLFQILLSEFLFAYFNKPPEKRTIARHSYYLCVASWAMAGLAAMLLHAALYDFPWDSHLKLLSGYWVLGGGILAQWVYVIFEDEMRKEVSAHQYFLERIARRITEGQFIFTFVPSMAMLLVVMRLRFEGYVEWFVVAEVAYLGLFCVLIAIVVTLKYGKGLKKDVAQMVSMLKKIEDGQLGATLKMSRADELGEVSNGINHMVQGLRLREQIKEAFGRFVDPKVASDFIEKYVKNPEVEMGGKRRRVTILMCDLRDFTPLAESMEPEVLTSLLNGYFSEMVAVIQKNGGIVDKFIGDAIMAVFGVLEESENSPLAAVKAALDMQSRLQAFNAQAATLGRPVLRAGIGIHVGEVVAGYLGSTDRLEFTVIGTPVNMAARIESFAKPPNPPILFSKEVAEAVEPHLPVEYITTASLKGMSQPVDLFSVKSPEAV